MMRFFFSFLFTGCLVANGFGQLVGQFTTAAGQPIPFASILLLNLVDSTLVKGSLTDEQGVFRMENSTPGTYLLRFTSVGYQTWHSPVFELTASPLGKDFGTLMMREDTRQLGEVVVRAEKPLFEQQVAGTIVNVESSLMSKGSSVLGVLERSPGVVIDYQNNSLTLNGKSGVMVMLNGKLMRLPLAQVVALLNGMNANEISTIELLTTPPSRYDAEGSAGLINIVTKKNKNQGTNGSVSGTGGYGWGEKGSGSVSLSHTTGKLDLYGSYLFSHDRTYTDLFILSSQNMPVFGGRLDVVAWDTTTAVQNNHTATVGIDYKINPKTGVGGSINFNRNTTSSTRYAGATYTILPDSLLLYEGKVQGDNRWKNLSSTVYLERELRPGEKFTADLDYLYFKNDNPATVYSLFQNRDRTPVGSETNLFAPRQQSFAHTTLQVGVFKVDYSKPIAPKLKIETGLKATYSGGSSVSGIESQVDGVWIGRSETVTTIRMKERIGAAYASVNAQLNASIQLAAGVRYEHSQTRMDDPNTSENTINRRLGAWFPTVSFSKKVNPNAEWQLSYTKRISRPSYNDLASYVLYSDPTAVYTGNPALKPTITSNLKLGYTFRNYSFSLLFSRDKYPIARYQITEREARNLLYVSPQNLAWQNNLTFQTNLPWKLNNWWTMNAGFVGGLRQFRVEHTRIPVEKSYFGYSVNFSQTFKLPGRFSAELSGWYNSTAYNGSIKVTGFGALNAGVKKELKNDAGSLQLSISDILRTLQINPYYGTLTQEAFSIKNHVQVNTESTQFPIIKLTYSRSFGNIHSNKKSQRKAGSMDERERVRKE
ncbi:TonB-dependent receptor domain-containing protein [Larkinella humicola]|uniref:TonB-dependent receptor n=1 Tax=Larkinella humicola TaxID=2607654 RepID=A0A5N1JRT1_9BACT|nr:TonB-dependent receptor [Larkinella humicola]KAA9357022.1 TonB-dependent receptor [Larkinella humicola]